MDDLKTLIEAVAKLPQMAIWVVVMFWAYKVVVIGSVYGLIRFVVSKGHDYLVKQKELPPKVVEVRKMLDDICITGQEDAVIAQLRRIIKDVPLAGGMTYLHRHHVQWLRGAIDDRLVKDEAAGLAAAGAGAASW